MTSKLHLDTALRHRDETVTWMMTPQAAVMAQIDEQQRGKHAGLHHTEANGVRKYNSYDEVELKNRDASTTYKITYQ